MRHRRQPDPIREQAADLLGETGTGQLGVGDHDRRPRSLHETGVGGLVVGRGVGVGDEHGGAARGRDLEDRAAGASDHEIAGEERFPEVGDVAAQVVVRPRRAELADVSLAGGVEDVKAGARERLERGVVDRAGPLRAAEHDHARFARADPEPGPRRETVDGSGRHRSAGDAVAGSVAALDRERQEHQLGHRSQHAVRQSEVAVGLHQDERDPARDSRQPDGCRDVAAGAERRRRTGVPHDPQRRPHGRGVDHRGTGRLCRALAVQGLNADRVQLIPGGGHELELRPLATDERDLSALSP